MAHNLFGLPYDIPTQNLPRGPQDTGLSITTQAKIAAGAVATAGYIGGKVLEGTVSYGGRFIPTGNTRAGKRFRSGGQDLITEHFPTKKQKTSQFNLRSKDNMPTETPEAVPSGAAETQGATGTANSKGHETKVIPIPQHITFGLPGFTTTKLMYRSWSIIDWGDNTTNIDTTQDIKFRMNSIYDVDYNTNAPLWRDYFVARYNYYTVLGCEYKIKYKNLNTTDWTICYRTYGAEVPGFATHHSTLKTDPHMKNVDLPYSDAIQTTTAVTGYASHEDYKANIQEIIQDGNDNIWTAIGGAPALVHDLRIMPRRHAIAGEINETMDLEIELVYTVQFKELNSTYRFNNTA